MPWADPSQSGDPRACPAPARCGRGGAAERFLGRQQRIDSAPPAWATTAPLHRLGFAAVVVHPAWTGRPTASGAARDVLQSQPDVPVLVLGIGTAEQAAAAIAALDGLRVIAGRATICKRAGRLLAPPRLYRRWMATDCTCSRS